jgi:hypothetical protein
MAAKRKKLACKENQNREVAASFRQYDLQLCYGLYMHMNHENSFHCSLYAGSPLTLHNTCTDPMKLHDGSD